MLATDPPSEELRPDNRSNPFQLGGSRSKLHSASVSAEGLACPGVACCSVLLRFNFGKLQDLYPGD